MHHPLVNSGRYYIATAFRLTCKTWFWAILDIQNVKPKHMVTNLRLDIYV